MKSQVDYDRPVRLQYLRMQHSAQVVDSVSGQSTERNFIDSTKGYAIEMHLRSRIVRIWCTRFDKAPVTTIAVSDGMSWRVPGEVENTLPEGPRAA
jgi:hypothetical protein